MEIEDYQTLELIRKYKCVPREVLFALLCNNKKQDKKFVCRSLRRLKKDGLIEYSNEQSAYYIPPYNKIEKNMIKALYVLAESSNVTDNFPSTNMVLISFVRNNELYEIIHIDTKTYRISLSALSQNIDDNNKPKRIVIVDDDEEANNISDDVLKQLNCVVLCSVNAKTGEIESYNFGE